MTVASYAQLLRELEAITATAAHTLDEMQRGDLAVNRKELRDVVTDADLASERIVIDGLRVLTPGAAILAEESGFSGSADAPRWIIDPLDGTVNYAAGLPWYSVTAAYQEGGRTRVGIVHAPRAGLTARYVENDIATVNDLPARVSTTSSLADSIVSVIITSHFSDDEVARAAEVVRRLGNLTRGVRIIVSGGLEMSMVAAAQFDAYVSLKADIVSHAAAMPIVRAAGGRVTRLDGVDSRDEDLEKVVSNSAIHVELLDRLQGV